MPLLDEGFESGGVGTPWIVSAFPSGFSQERVHSGAYSARLVSEGFNGGGASQTFATTPGTAISVAVWLLPTATGRPLTFHIDVNPGDGSNLVQIDSFLPSSADVWTYREYPTVVAETSQATVFWSNAAPGVGGEVSWFLDDISLLLSEDEDMARKWDAIDAALNVIRGINGTTDGFNVNLEGRVYSRVFFPRERPSDKLPYVCVPLDQEAERIEYESFLFVSAWTLTGYAFFPDNPESDVNNSAGAETAAKFRDDLVRAFMNDRTLNGTAHYGEVKTIETTSGSVEDPATWVIFTIDFMQMAGATDLTAA